MILNASFRNKSYVSHIHIDIIIKLSFKFSYNSKAYIAVRAFSKAEIELSLDEI